MSGNKNKNQIVWKVKKKKGKKNKIEKKDELNFERDPYSSKVLVVFRQVRRQRTSRCWSIYRLPDGIRFQFCPWMFVCFFSVFRAVRSRTRLCSFCIFFYILAFDFNSSLLSKFEICCPSQDAGFPDSIFCPWFWLMSILKLFRFVCKMFFWISFVLWIFFFSCLLSWSGVWRILLWQMFASHPKFMTTPSYFVLD